MKMPGLLLSENSRVIVSISTLLLVIGFSITATFTFTTWKTEAEQKTISLEKKINQVQIEYKKEDEYIKDDIQILKVISEENKTDMVEIKTDIKWIRAYMEQQQ